MSAKQENNAELDQWADLRANTDIGQEKVQALICQLIRAHFFAIVPQIDLLKHL